MGYLLHQKHGDKVFHIRLHLPDMSPSMFEPEYRRPGPQMMKCLERIMESRGNAPVGFDIVGSPFERLRDVNSVCYRWLPGACFSDVASGYIFLKPWKDLDDCDWLEGYFSQEMFVRNKPYYQGFTQQKMGQRAMNVEELNALFDRRN